MITNTTEENSIISGGLVVSTFFKEAKTINI